MTIEKLHIAKKLYDSIDACQCVIEEIEQGETVRINTHNVRGFKKELQSFLVETKKRLEQEFDAL